MVEEPGLVHPDPTFKKKLDPYPTLEKHLDPDLNPDPQPRLKATTSGIYFNIFRLYIHD